MTARRVIASLALVAVAPVAAAAQFTTFVSPPERVDTLIVFDTAGRPSADSLSRASMANMKAWVDSAAGDAIDLGARTDTTPLPPVQRDVFGREGIPAPDTATPLPLVLTLGVGAVAAGLALLRRR